MRDQRTDVLVVGAGPVGLMTAILLAEAGVEVVVVDREERTASRSYACALHPRTLAILNRLGILDSLLRQGRRIQKIGFFEGPKRQATLDLGALQGPCPFVLIVPQNVFESALEQALHQKFGVSVNWNHRFESYQTQSDQMEATIEELGGTSQGYVVPHWEKVVQRQSQISARCIVGTDGQYSTVRQRVGIPQLRVSGPYFFAAYEFESDTPPDDELKVVMDPQTTNVLWPLQNNCYRWTFQLLKTDGTLQFPEKERRAVRLARGVVDEKIRAYVEKVAKARAPWFTARVKEIRWCTDVVFEQRLARDFASGRCWLAGDAAHQTGPAGAQSMNVGFLEAEHLAAVLPKVLREETPQDLLTAYNQEWREQWQALLGMNDSLTLLPKADPWVESRMPRLLSCFPASGADLEALAPQLGLSFASRAFSAIAKG